MEKMSAKYVSQKPERKLNDESIFVTRGRTVTLEAFAKAGACRNLAPQSSANYGKKKTNGGY